MTSSTRLCFCTAALSLLAASCRTAPATVPTPRPLPVAAAAAPAQPAPSPTPPTVIVTDDGRPVDLDVQVEALVGDGPAAMVKSGQRLKSGDRLAVHVVPSANAYVAVALVSSDGEAQILFPTQGPGILAAGTVERVPSAGKWFRLDKSAGREDIYVYASKHPLAPDDIIAKVKAVAGAVRQAAAKKPAKASGKGARKSSPDTTEKHGPSVAENDAPGAITGDTRSLELVDETAPQSAVTKKRFSIKHEK